MRRVQAVLVIRQGKKRDEAEAGEEKNRADGERGEKKSKLRSRETHGQLQTKAFIARVCPNRQHQK